MLDFPTAFVGDGDLLKVLAKERKEMSNIFQQQNAELRRDDQKLRERDEKLRELGEKLHDRIDKMAEQMGKQNEQITRLHGKNNEQAEQLTKLQVNMGIFEITFQSIIKCI